MTNAIGTTLIYIKKRLIELDDQIAHVEITLDNLQCERSELIDRQDELFEGIDCVKKDGSVVYIGEEIEST